MATYRKPLKDINGNFIIPAMTGDQTGWVKPADLENGNLYDKFIAIDGTEIADNSDLNTTAFLDLGMYFKNTNSGVATLSNCPTTFAFTMRVYSPSDNSNRDKSTQTWVTRIREITDMRGDRWIQRASSQDVAGSFTYYSWEKILDSTDGDLKVDVPNDNIDNYNGTLLDLVKGIYPENYHRWGTTTDGATANISDKPTGTTNRGFVLEAYLSRNVNASDYSYRLVCWSDRYSTVYTTYIRTSDQSITWEKLIDTTSVGGVTPTMLEKGNLYDKLIALDGTEIPSSSDLNTTAFLDLGMYFCARNVDVQTLTNCPTTSAFTMRVYSPNDNHIRNTMTEAWVYRVREITDIQGRKWNQNASSGATAGTFTYGAWKQVIDERRVLSATAVRDAGWSADKDYIPDMSMFAYWDGAYGSSKASNLKYFANNSITYNNLVKAASGDYWTKPAYVNASGVTEAGKYIDFHNTAGSANNYDVRLMVNSAGQTTVTIPNKTGTMALTNDIRNTILRFTNVPTSTTTITGTTNAGTAYSIRRTNYGANNIVYTSGSSYFQKVRVTCTTYFNGTITSAYGVNGLKASTKIYAYWSGTKNGTNECNRSATDVEGPSDGCYYGTAINAGGNKANTTISYEAIRANSSGQWHLFGHIKSAGADNALTFEIECTAVDNYTVPSVYQRGVPSSTNRNIVTIEILE